MNDERKILGLVFCTVIMAIALITGNATAHTLQWERFWGGSGDDSGNGIFVSGGNIYVSGRTMSFGAGEYDAIILKYDLSGTLINDTTWGGSTLDVGRKVYVSDGNIYVAGTTWDGWQNAAILKFDPNCNLLWYRVWGCPYYPGGYDNMNDLFVIGEDIYCVGDTEFGFGNPRLLLQRYDTEGNLKWTSFWGPIGYNVHTVSQGITVSGSDIYIAGSIESEPGDIHPWDALIMRYDTQGNLIWSRTWGGTGHEYAYGISVLGNDVYVVGYTNSYGAGDYDIFLLKYDSEGNFIWYKTWGGNEEDYGYDICILNGQIHVAGTTKSFGAGGYDAVTLITDLSGNLISYETWGGTADDWAHGLHALGNEIYVVGDTTSFGSGGRDIFLFARAQPPPAANLDQVRNGPMGSPISPGNWVNGNLNPSQSHYIESYSIPYRAVLTNLPTDGTVITLTIGYDIKHSDKHAIDYLTHYDHIDAPSHIGVYAHSAEIIDPLIGVSGVTGTTTTWPIPAPSSAGSIVPGQPTNSFNAIPDGERVITLFGGTISNVAYNVEGDLTAAKSETRVDITFTVDSSTAVLAWGGHIASRADWGFDGDEPRSAGGIPGSPYHMRLIDWNLNNLGNQDRSLQVEHGPDFVIPESPLGTIGTLLMFLAAIGAFAYKKQLPTLIK